MTSVAIKRGLATAAVSALAVTGLPFIAGAASAAPLASGYDKDAVELLAPSEIGSDAFDGVNETVRLLAGGGANITRAVFEYSLNGGQVWTRIGAADRAHGVFALEWAPPATAYGIPVTLRVTGYSAGGDAAASDRGMVTVQPTAESVDIAAAPGAPVGVFAQPYGVDHDADLAVVSGTTSDLSDAAEVSLAALGGGIGSADRLDEVSDGARARGWSGTVDLGGYDWTGTPDQAVVMAQNGSGDAEAVTLYEQEIADVTARALDASVPEGTTTDVVVTVVDQKGAPVAGAQVLRAAGGEPTYTDSRGEVVFADLGAGAHEFFVNTTGDLAYENGTDFAHSLTIAKYTPAATTLAARSTDGSAFDLDEHSAGDLAVVVRDQQGAPMPEGTTLRYSWAVDPFADGVAGSRTAERSATTGADGTAVVALPEATVPGSYTLEYFINRDGKPGQGTGDLAGAPLTVKLGQARIQWADGEIAQLPEGGTRMLEGALELEDGTALPGRHIDLAWTSAGDAVVAPQAAQPAGTKVADGGVSATTDAQGGFGVALRDTAETAKQSDDELGGDLVASTGDTPHIGDAGASAALVVDFLEKTAPGAAADIAVDVDRLIDDLATPGRPVDLDIAVSNGEGSMLGGYPVSVSVDHGFLSPDAETEGDLVPAETPSQGAAYGVWKSEGPAAALATAEDGTTGTVVAIARDKGFDVAEQVVTTVTLRAGSVVKSIEIPFTSESPLNGGALAIERAEDQSVTVLPKAPVGEHVAYDVFVTDQFGNLVAGESVSVTDAHVAAWVNWDDSTHVQSNLPGDPALWLSSTGAGAQTVTGTWETGTTTWVDGDTVTKGFQAKVEESAATRKASAETVEWYDVDLEQGSYTLSSNVTGMQKVGKTVIVTFTAVDQFGEPVEDLRVDFFRSGPDDLQDGDANGQTWTDERGKATYVFSGAKAGVATVEALAYNGATMVDGSAATMSVEFGSPKTAIAARLIGAGNGAKADSLTVDAPSTASGAVAKLFRVTAKGAKVLVASKRLNGSGDARFVVKDGKKGATTYVATVGSTTRTLADTSNTRRVR